MFNAEIGFHSIMVRSHGVMASVGTKTFEMHPASMCATAARHPWISELPFPADPGPNFSRLRARLQQVTPPAEERFVEAGDDDFEHDAMYDRQLEYALTGLETELISPVRAHRTSR